MANKKINKTPITINAHECAVIQCGALTVSVFKDENGNVKLVGDEQLAITLDDRKTLLIREKIG